MKNLFIIILITISTLQLLSEEKKVEWLTFEQLEDSLAVNPKKVYIDFYTEWCSYCRKMDKEVYTKQEVIDNINNEYYAVKFDAQSQEVVSFGGMEFINDQTKISRTPIHQIAQILASREDGFVPPAIVILNEDFKITERYFQYLDSDSLLDLINN